MSGGGKGGSQSTSVEIPAWLQQAAQRNIGRAEEISQTGFVPYYGPEVAAMTPQQQAAMESTGLAAQAYGLSDALGQQVTPQPETFAGGVQGYSSGGLYEQALAELEARRLGQFAALNAPFIDPVTGASPGGVFRTGAQQAQFEPQRGPSYSTGGGGGGFGGDGGAGSLGRGGGGVGYSGIGDAFDGGGPRGSTRGGRDFAGPNMDGTAGNDGPGVGGGGGMGGGK